MIKFDKAVEGRRESMRCSNCGKEYDSGDNAEMHDGLCLGCYNSKIVNDELSKYIKYKSFEQQPNVQFYQQGWVCPKCGSVMSPTQPYCLFCCSCGNTPVSVEATWSNSNTNIQT